MKRIIGVMGCTVERERSWEIYDPSPSEAWKEELSSHDCLSECMHAMFYHIISPHSRSRVPTNAYSSMNKLSHLARQLCSLIPARPIAVSL